MKPDAFHSLSPPTAGKSQAGDIACGVSVTWPCPSANSLPVDGMTAEHGTLLFDTEFSVMQTKCKPGETSRSDGNLGVPVWIPECSLGPGSAVVERIVARKSRRAGKPKVTSDRTSFNFGANVARKGRKRRGRKGGGS